MSRKNLNYSTKKTKFVVINKGVVYILDILDRILALLGNREQRELTDYLGLKSVAFSDWKSGKSKSYRKYLIEIAEYFNVSIDYLVYGKTTENIISLDLTENEKELISIFSQFSEREQIKVIGKVEDWLTEKQRRASEAKRNVQTAYIASRSFDNAPPRIVTGDFSDVLNAPDSTDEY